MAREAAPEAEELGNEEEQGLQSAEKPEQEAEAMGEDIDWDRHRRGCRGSWRRYLEGYGDWCLEEYHPAGTDR